MLLLRRLVHVRMVQQQVPGRPTTANDSKRENPQDRCALRSFSDMFKRKHRASVGCTPLYRGMWELCVGFCDAMMCFVLASSQGVGVLRSFSPTSLCEHMSMAQARNPPTHWTTLRVYSVL